YENYIGVEHVANQFLRLNLPKASEILDPSPGPGLLSARLQTKGYGNIDAIEDNPDDLKRLIQSNLYRTCIPKTVGGINSTGLKDDLYDAVVMVGGFCPSKMTPKAFNELLRITKPDGHLLWSIRADLHSKISDYKLLDDNISALEKSGKCVAMKWAENFRDPHSDLEGLLYLVKRIDTEDFKSTLPGEAQSDVVDCIKHDRLDELQQQHCLDDWSDRSEEDLVMVGQYSGHLKLCQAFYKLALPRNVEILDISCYTAAPGLVGMDLSNHGYVNVDGLDHKLKTLNNIRGHGRVYRNYILGKVDELGSIPVNDGKSMEYYLLVRVPNCNLFSIPESYDIVLTAGGFAPGKMMPSAFQELLRVLRPGGYVMWTMMDGFASKSQDYALFDVKIQDLVLERRWELLVGPVVFENFALHKKGRFYLLRKSHREVFALGSRRFSPHSSPKLHPRRGSLKIN
ncbi:hypothetical protein TCAL_11274, partial [Tigriopus californicus]